MAAWMMGADEIVRDIQKAHRRLQALGAYLPDELQSRFQAGEQQHARRDQPRGENRPTAVLFLNVIGFEAALDRARQAPAPREYERVVYEALDDFFIEVHRIINRYGGIVSRIDPYRDGSKLLVLFGAPRAHEDDIERAVRAATAARQALETFHRGWAHRFRSYQRVLKTPPPIQLRTGITYGVTFAGEVGSPTRREYTVMGDDVNLAARLMTAAKPGQILATSTVQAALTSQLRASSLPPIRVKGKINPIPVYQIEGIADTALKPTRQRRQPLIGRDAELTRAIEVLSQAQKGAGRSLIVSGEAGIGKSHFAETLSQHAQERGARILMMRCTSFGRTPYSPWVHLFQGILEQYGDTAPSDSARSATLQVWLEELGITEAEDARPLYQLLGLPYQTGLSLTKTHARTQRPSETTRSRQARGSAPATGLFAHLSRAQPAPKSDEPPQAGGLWDLTAQRQHSATSTKNAQLWQHLEHQVAERERAGLFSVITQVITGLADKQPLVLTVENAHWMDAASRDLLHHVSESLTNQPILIVRVQRNQDNRMPSRPHEVHLSLPPLNLESSLKLVEHLLHDVVAPDKAGDVGRVMYEKSRGNPLVIEALSTWWRDHQESGLELSAGFRASNILYDLVISRLDALSPVERNVVRTASILGIDVDQELLYHLLTPDIVETTLASALDHLEEAGFLQRSATATEARWFFQQPLIREIVYESLSLATRRARHRAAAHYLETHAAKEITSMAERLADHHRRAHQWLPAARYDLMSGHKARRQHAYAQARSAYTSALTMTARYTGAPAQITPLFVQAHEALGDLELLEEKFEQAEDHYRTAHHTLDESDPQQAGEPGAAPKPATPDIARRLPPPAARLALKHALTLPAAGREADAQQMAHDVWQHGPDDYRTIAAVTLAWLYCRTGGPDTSRWIERAASMARQYQGQGSERLHALTDHLHPNCEEPIFIQGLFHALTATSQDDAATHLSCTMSIMSTERMHDDQQ
jgi:class 3 adenylate cyclase/tetratricopeptide (TPR) repeat protein